MSFLTGTLSLELSILLSVIILGGVMRDVRAGLLLRGDGDLELRDNLAPGLGLVLLPGLLLLSLWGLLFGDWCRGGVECADEQRDSSDPPVATSEKPYT